MFLVFTTGFHPGGQLYDVTKVILYFHSGNNYTGKSFQKSPNLCRPGLSINPKKPNEKSFKKPPTLRQAEFPKTQ